MLPLQNNDLSKKQKTKNKPLLRKCLKGKQVHVNKTFVLQAVWLIWFIVAEGQQEAAFHRCNNEQSYRFETMLKTQRWDLKPKHITVTGSGAPSLHDRT